MYAESRIIFNNEVPVADLFHSTQIVRPEDVITDTRLASIPNIAGSFTAAIRLPNCVILILPEGHFTVSAHVETTPNKGDLRLLKNAAETAAQMIISAGKRKHCRCSRVEIKIFAENNLIQIGTRLTLIRRLAARFREQIIGDILVTAGTGLSSYICSYFVQVDKLSLITPALTVFIALMLWLFLGAAKGNEYEYADP